MKMERRTAEERIEVRSAEAGLKQIAGYGAVFNAETVIGGFFREKIMPGAFKPVIGKSADVRSLFNHDPNYVLGRTSAGTLTLSEDATGLRYVTDLNPDDTQAQSVAAKAARGDVTGSSFGFRVKRDEWTRATRSGELPLRTIHEYAEILDVGPVTYPAYEETTAEARDAAAALVGAEDLAEQATGNVLALARSRNAWAIVEAEL